MSDLTANQKGRIAPFHFLGNGLTKDTAVHYAETPFATINQSIQYGPVETFTRDKNPRTLGELERAGIVTRAGIVSFLPGQAAPRCPPRPDNHERQS
ncbi:MAG: hypothetical protein II007_07655 [Gammaproteobacteria bacterium]|nr:hypothetical protein [Gammaproteobacteria bacterium]